ncbi:V-type ATP synthase subunit E [Pyrolobus fumarii]|uniref:V-type ATP synthase subunit E n=1 Tax=Pyrolobus fumarii TaxID=54252 RepID=UPI00064EED9C|nr:V-type ATP synthase subunit E [Pyrolobus fumarii]
MPRIHMHGDPHAVAKKASEKVREEINKKIDEALDAAIRILDAAKNRALAKLEKDISAILREAEEKVRAERAVREAELRVAELNARNEWIEKAVNEALRRLRSRVGDEAYTAFLEDMLKRAAETIRETATEAVVYPTKADRDLLEKLVGGASLPVKFTLAGEDIEGVGGFVVATPDGKMRLDYRLEAVLSDILEEAKAAAAKALFG